MARASVKTETASFNVKAFVEALAAKEVNVITDTAKLDAESVNLTQSIKEQDKRISDYLWSEVLHIEQHRNPTRLNKFLTANAKRGARVDAMVKFITNVANVRSASPKELAAKEDDKYVLPRIIDDQKKVIMMQYLIVLKPRTEEQFKEKLENALKIGDWYAHKAPPSVTPYNLEDLLVSLINGALARKVSDKHTDKDVIDDNLITSLVTIAEARGLKSRIKDKEKEAMEKNAAAQALQVATVAAQAAVSATTTPAPKNARKSRNSGNGNSVAA